MPSVGNSFVAVCHVSMNISVYVYGFNINTHTYEVIKLIVKC